MTTQEERRVIAQVLGGDKDRFEALVRAHETLVYNLALGLLSDPQDALDASQEAFLRAYRALPSFRGDSKFSVWLYRLTYNVCMDMLRRRSREARLSLSPLDETAMQVPDQGPGPDQTLEDKELRQAVRAALGQLEPEFRQILTLRELGGLSYEEIGAATGLGPGTVKSRLFRARRKIADILTAWGNIPGQAASNDIKAERRSNGKGGRENG